MSKIPKLPKDSVHQPTSNSPSPSEGLLKATQPDDLRKDYTDKLSKKMGEVGDHQIDPINHTQPDNTIDGELRLLQAKKLMEWNEERYGEPTILEYLRHYKSGIIKEIHIEAAIAQEANKAVVAELEKIVDWDVPASYEQDGKNWQGLAIPRNLIRKRMLQRKGQIMGDKNLNDILNDSKREGEKMLRDMHDATHNPKDPQADIREAIEKIIIKMARDATAGDRLGNALIYAAGVETGVNKLLALFQAHQQELLSELLGHAREYEVTDLEKLDHWNETPLVAVPVSVIQSKIGELNG